MGLCRGQTPLGELTAPQTSCLDLSVPTSIDNGKRGKGRARKGRKGKGETEMPRWDHTASITLAALSTAVHNGPG